MIIFPLPAQILDKYKQCVFLKDSVTNITRYILILFMTFLCLYQGDVRVT